MMVLTVKQPWAWGLIHGPKRVENRSWPTSYRGPLAIHAGKSRTALGDEGDLFPGMPGYGELVYGAIIGVVDLVECVPVTDARVAGGPFAEGPWCWVTENPRPVEPHYCAGSLSLWVPPKAFSPRWTGG